MDYPPQLIVTLGPASWPLAGPLRDAGATAYRLNASHLALAELAQVLAHLREQVPDAVIHVDLQGAKMRLGSNRPRDVARGDRLAFVLDPGGDGVSLPHPEFFAQVRPRDTVSVDDGRLRFRVEDVRDDRLEAEALEDGLLRPRKGVNLVEHPIVLAGLTAADRAAVSVSLSHGARSFAFSFMLDGREADWLREAAPGCAVTGKVERHEAAGALESIAQRVDAIWICRGDLGAQVGAAHLGHLVASIAPSRIPVPVFMAGQVFEHLTRHREPTRSEVCHVHDLVARGYAGLVLSDETAIGDDPVNATVVAASLLRDFHSLNTAG